MLKVVAPDANRVRAVQPLFVSAGRGSAHDAFCLLPFAFCPLPSSPAFYPLPSIFCPSPLKLLQYLRQQICRHFRQRQSLPFGAKFAVEGTYGLDDVAKHGFVKVWLGLPSL